MSKQVWQSWGHGAAGMEMQHYREKCRREENNSDLKWFRDSHERNLLSLYIIPNYREMGRLFPVRILIKAV